MAVGGETQSATGQHQQTRKWHIATDSNKHGYRAAVILFPLSIRSQLSALLLCRPLVNSERDSDLDIWKHYHRKGHDSGGGAIAVGDRLTHPVYRIYSSLVVEVLCHCGRWCARGHARPTEWGSACSGRPGQHVEEQGTCASRTRKRSEAGCGRPEDGGVWATKTVKRPPQQPAQPHGTSCHIQHSPGTPTTGLHERGNDTSRSTGRSGRQKAATRRNMRREERVTVQAPVKKQQPDGMLHMGRMGGREGRSRFGAPAYPSGASV